MSTFPVALFVAFALTSVCAAIPSLNPVSPVSSSVLLPVEEETPQPYNFGFEFGDGLGMNQHRQEVADGTGAVKGSYGYVDPFGVSRVVEYTADEDGYKAVIRTNEPGTLNENPANAVYVVQPPSPAAIAQGLRSSYPKIVV